MTMSWVYGMIAIVSLVKPYIGDLRLNYSSDFIVCVSSVVEDKFRPAVSFWYRCRRSKTPP